MSSAQPTIKGSIRSGLAVFFGCGGAGGEGFSPEKAVDIAVVLGGQGPEYKGQALQYTTR